VLTYRVDFTPKRGEVAANDVKSVSMQPLRAHVRRGRLVLDEPTDLPEGEVAARSQVKIRFSGPAQKQADRLDRRWRKHRPDVPDLFARELETARQSLLVAPEILPAYVERRGVSSAAFYFRRSAQRRAVARRFGWSPFSDLNRRPALYEGQQGRHGTTGAAENKANRETSSPEEGRAKYASDHSRTNPGSVEDALAMALEGATAAGRWDVVAQLAKELEARRLARTPNVVAFDTKTRQRGA
jgi:hypothetical protein